MQTEELKKLAQDIQRLKSENQTIEVKSAHGGFPKIYNTLSSFSNQDDGGTILFGIDEKAGYSIVGVHDPMDIQKKISEACNQMEPKVRALTTVAEVEGKTIVSAEIPGIDISLRPLYYRGTGVTKGSYIRVGDADEQMTAYEIYNYESFRKRAKDDLRPVSEVNISLFNQRRLSEYLELVKQDRKNLASNISDTDILDLMGVTVRGVPSLAGVMTFSLYPQTWFPQLCITAVVVPGIQIGDQTDDGMRFIDNKRITGSIPDMLEDAVEFVRKNSRSMTVVDKHGNRVDKPEYPLRAVREAILNGLIHRDYSQYTENTPMSIEMYRDRIVFRSSGVLFGRESIQMLGKSRPEPRNAALMNMLEVLKITENRYSGIPTMYHDLRELDMPDPVFEIRRGEFIATFYNSLYETPAHNLERKDMMEALLEYCRTPRSRAEITAFTGKSAYYTAKAYLNPLLDAGRLMRTIPCKPKSPMQRFVSRKQIGKI